jgi:hypothetical protein
MSHQRLIMAIGRIERALSRMERIEISSVNETGTDAALSDRHEKLKAETLIAIRDIDGLIARGVL